MSHQKSWPADKVQSEIRPGQQINPEHCNWHNQFVRSGRCNWDCNKACILADWHSDQDLQELKLDQQITLGEAIEWIGPETWEVIKDCPQDVYDALSTPKESGDQPKALFGKMIYSPLLGPGTPPPVPYTQGVDHGEQTLFPTGAAAPESDLLIWETYLEGLMGIPFWCDHHEGMKLVFRQMRPRDPLEGMMLAKLVNTYLRARLLPTDVSHLDPADQKVHHATLNEMALTYSRQLAQAKKILAMP